MYKFHYLRRSTFILFTKNIKDIYVKVYSVIWKTNKLSDSLKYWKRRTFIENTGWLIYFLYIKSSVYLTQTQKKTCMRMRLLTGKSWFFNETFNTWVGHHNNKVSYLKWKVFSSLCRKVNDYFILKAFVGICLSFLMIFKWIRN